jgi:protocatechuate 3,4-dioxygenase beta subunit
MALALVALWLALRPAPVAVPVSIVRPVATPAATQVPAEEPPPPPRAAPKVLRGDGPTTRSLAVVDGAAAVVSTTQDDVTSTSLDLARAFGVGQLAGWVVDPQQRPVVGAEVVSRLVRAPGGAAVAEEDEEPFAIAVSTDSAGMFYFDELPAGEWALTARASGLGDATEAPVRVTPGIRADPVRIRLDGANSLEGTVVDRGDRPVKGVAVRALRPVVVFSPLGEREIVRLDVGRAATPADGRFRFEGLGDGPVELTFRAAGLASVERRLDGPRTDLRIVMEPEAPFAGIVRDARGSAIANATITAFAKGSTKAPLAEALSAREGRWVIQGLGAGIEVDVYAKAAGYAKAGPVRLTTGTQQNVIVLGAGGAVEGRVVRREDASPVAGATVVASIGGARGFRTATRADGTYRLEHLPPGEYDIRLRDESLVAVPRLDVDVRDGATRQGIDFSAYRGIALHGKVVDRATGEGIRGALVRLDAFEGPRLLAKRDATTLARESGSFTFPLLPEGGYRVAASADHYVASDVAGDRVIALLRSGETPDPVMVRLDAAGSIEGLVVDGGASVARAEVSLLFDAATPVRFDLGRFRATVGSAGTFRIDGIPIVAEPVLRAMALTEAGRRGVSDAIALHPQQPQAEATIQIQPGSDVALTVRGRYGKPLAGAQVEAWLESPALPGADVRWTAKTDETGTAVITAVPSGRLHFTARAMGYIERSASIEVPRETAGSITLARGAVLTGSLTDDGSRALAGAAVTATDARGAIVASATTDSMGGFTLDGVPAEEIRVLAAVPIVGCPDARVAYAAAKASVPEQGSVALVSPCRAVLRGTVRSAGTGDRVAKFRVELRGRQPLADGTEAEIAGAADFADGAWAFSRVAAGRYRVRVEAEGYLPYESELIDVASPGETVAEEIALRPGGGIVVRALERASGDPIAGVTVRVRGTGLAARTNAQGIARIRSVMPGVYDLDLASPDHLPAERALVTVARGREANAGDVRMDRGGVIAGVVVDARGRPIVGAGIEVSAASLAENRFESTDARGRFAMRGLPFEDVCVTASTRVQGRTVRRSAMATVAASQPDEIRITLSAGGSLRGRIVPPPGVDANRTIVDVVPIEADQRLSVSQRRAAESWRGSYRIGDLAEGVYLVLAQAPRGSETVYWSAIGSVGSEPATADLVAGSLMLGGTVRRAAGGAALPMHPLALGWLGTPAYGHGALRPWWQRRVRADTEGRWWVGDLASGSYEITSRAPGSGDPLLDIVSLPLAGTGLLLVFEPEPAVTVETGGSSAEPVRTPATPGPSAASVP